MTTLSLAALLLMAGLSADPTPTEPPTATPTSSPSTSTLAAHPEPFDSASLPRGYAQDRLRAEGAESRGTTPPGAALPLPSGERAGVRGAPLPTPDDPWSLDLTVGDFGLGIGGSHHIDGLRLAFRDTAGSVVHGVSVTVWSPAEGGHVDVDGLALGLPLHVARRLRGVGVGLGLGATGGLDGIGVGLLGAGAGERVRGLIVGGLGAGAGDRLEGLAVGGLGAGAGDGGFGVVAGGLGAGVGAGFRGLVLGGLGAGVGGDLAGLALGGLGAGGGGSARGVVVGGLGAGVGQDLRGVVVGGLGAGVGRDLDGVAVGGLGAGAGGTLRGLAVAGLGAGAPRVRGALVALVAGGRDVVGVVVAPAHLYIERGGRLAGLGLGAVNLVRGEQHGLTIGLFNYAASLQGLQLGLLNYAGNNPAGLRLLPLANAHLD